jgi:flavorubredoxin
MHNLTPNSMILTPNSHNLTPNSHNLTPNSIKNITRKPHQISILLIGSNPMSNTLTPKINKTSSKLKQILTIKNTIKIHK